SPPVPFLEAVMTSEKLLHSDLTEVILKAFYHVYNKFGYGFLEKVYENALALTLRKRGLAVEQQKPVTVEFEGEPVGEYFADLLVANCVILELKAADAINAAHEAQLLNYLKATNIEVGFVLNFGPKAEFRRKVFTNDRKQMGHG